LAALFLFGAAALPEKGKAAQPIAAIKKQRFVT
jgi:hypothetical protein